LATCEALCVPKNLWPQAEMTFARSQGLKCGRLLQLENASVSN
jgi:hypothetical protein